LRPAIVSRLLRTAPGAICVVAVLAALPGVAAAQRPTAATLRGEIRALLDRTARQWAGMVTPAGVFQNPFAADLARGHGSFVPPMLAYAVHRAGERRGDAKLVAAAERAWPQAVDPVRASAFDMIGAAYAYRTLALSERRRRQLAEYMSRYGIPPNGYDCLVIPRCYGNLRLVDALAVLSITGAGVSSPDPAARLGNPALARTSAAAVINTQVGQNVDHGLRATLAGRRVRGTYLSDPSMNPLAYHALSAFTLSEAITELGPAASHAARRVRRETMDALAALVAPDGDMTYLGRGQGQAWVPAIVAAALANAARDVAPRDVRRAGRYLAAARRAVRRLRSLHASAHGLQLVPGATARTTADGIDGYAHTVAYNGLAMFGLTEALEALRATPAVPIGPLPSAHHLVVQDSRTSGLGVVSDGRTWLAVHRKPTAVADLRFDSGALAIKRRTAHGWRDLLAPRPLAVLAPSTGGPALMHKGTAIPLSGFGITARGRAVTVDGGYRANRHRWIRRVRFRWRLTRRGVRITLSGARRGDHFRMLAFTPAGSGARGRRMLLAAGARWRFDRPIRGARIPGYHSGPVERLDALEALVTAPKSGRMGVTIERH
jgi:hypothetical protein